MKINETGERLTCKNVETLQKGDWEEKGGTNTAQNI